MKDIRFSEVTGYSISGLCIRDKKEERSHALTDKSSYAENAQMEIRFTNALRTFVWTTYHWTANRSRQKCRWTKVQIQIRTNTSNSFVPYDKQKTLFVKKKINKIKKILEKILSINLINICRWCIFLNLYFKNFGKILKV